MASTILQKNEASLKHFKRNSETRRGTVAKKKNRLYFRGEEQRGFLFESIGRIAGGVLSTTCYLKPAEDSTYSPIAVVFKKKDKKRSNYLAHLVSLHYLCSTSCQHLSSFPNCWHLGLSRN